MSCSSTVYQPVGLVIGTHCSALPWCAVSYLVGLGGIRVCGWMGAQSFTLSGGWDATNTRDKTSHAIMQCHATHAPANAHRAAVLREAQRENRLLDLARLLELRHDGQVLKREAHDAVLQLRAEEARLVGLAPEDEGHLQRGPAPRGGLEGVAAQVHVVLHLCCGGEAFVSRLLSCVEVGGGSRNAFLTS